jgi:hypothetical protein
MLRQQRLNVSKAQVVGELRRKLGFLEPAAAPGLVDYEK